MDSKFKTLFKSPSNVVVNCLIELNDNIKVLGTDRGLFSYYEDSLLHIEGVENVEQVGTVDIVVDVVENIFSCRRFPFLNLPMQF